MGLNLLNWVAKETETGPEVWGCKECHLIFDISVYSSPLGGLLTICPCCGTGGMGENLAVLGPLPCVISKGGWIYLTDDKGRMSRGYRTIQEAHQDLWSWFVEKGNHDGSQEEGPHQEDDQEGLKKIIPLWGGEDR
jgi:hypothetical protein